MRGGVRFFARPGPLHGMQYFVALVDAGPQFLLARKVDGVVQVTDDTAVVQVQLGGEIKVDRHGCITGADMSGSGHCMERIGFVGTVSQTRD